MKSKFKTSNSRHDEEPAEALHHLVGAEEHDGLRKLGREAGPVVAENELDFFFRQAALWPVLCHNE